MSPLRVAVALTLVLAVTPGLGELFEAGGHFWETGHVAHASETHPDGTPASGDEHGCSGTFHLCGCCARVSFAPPVKTSLPLPIVADRSRPAAPFAPATEAHASGPFRPPRSA